MSTISLAKPAAASALDKVYFTRCPVPTATGLAYKLGWLGQEFAADGIAVETLQEGGSWSCAATITTMSCPP